jgi:hypothetical protein
MRDYFNLDTTYQEKKNADDFARARLSSSLLQKPWRSMMIGLI